MPYKELTKGRISYRGVAYLATMATAGRAPVFRNFEHACIVARELRRLHTRGICELLSWVVMPDHVHALLVVNEQPLSDLMQELKGRSARAINARNGRRGCIWQNGFHDHGVRREEDLLAISRYIIVNPLRAGLVKSLADYPFWDAKWL